jgi:hypothetical protein
MTDADRVKLLHGPDRPPRLRKGDRAFCLYRDADVVVTSWTERVKRSKLSIPAYPGQRRTTTVRQ